MEGILASVSAAPWMIVAVLVVIAIFIFIKPIRFVLKLLISAVLGFAALIIINKFGAYIGVSLGVNWLNAVVVGILGIPGVALLFVLKWLMLI